MLALLKREVFDCIDKTCPFFVGSEVFSLVDGEDKHFVWLGPVEEPMNHE